MKSDFCWLPHLSKFVPSKLRFRERHWAAGPLEANKKDETKGRTWYKHIGGEICGGVRIILLPPKKIISFLVTKYKFLEFLSDFNICVVSKCWFPSFLVTQCYNTDFNVLTPQVWMWLQSNWINKHQPLGHPMRSVVPSTHPPKNKKTSFSWTLDRRPSFERRWTELLLTHHREHGFRWTSWKNPFAQWAPRAAMSGTSVVPAWHCFQRNDEMTWTFKGKERPSRCETNHWKGCAFFFVIGMWNPETPSRMQSSSPGLWHFY